jgi:hypothetical protein
VTVVSASAWGVWVLRLQPAQLHRAVLHEE